MTWRFRIAKDTFCYDIQYGRHSSNLENLLLLADLELCLSCGLLTMVWPSHVCPSVTFYIFYITIRVVSMMATMVAILKVFSCYLLPNSKLNGAETWWRALVPFDIQDDHHGSRLENLQITSAPER